MRRGLLALCFVAGCGSSAGDGARPEDDSGASDGVADAPHEADGAKDAGADQSVDAPADSSLDGDGGGWIDGCPPEIVKAGPVRG